MGEVHQFKFVLPNDTEWYQQLEEKYFQFFPSERNSAGSRMPKVGDKRPADPDQELPLIDAVNPTNEEQATAGDRQQASKAYDRLDDASVMLGHERILVDATLECKNYSALNGAR